MAIIINYLIINSLPASCIENFKILDPAGTRVVDNNGGGEGLLGSVLLSSCMN